MPYQWGYNVLAYNTTVFKEPPRSWGVVFRETTLPDGKSNKGRIQAFDGPIYIADAALYLMHTAPELGIKNPYELDDRQYKAALDLLGGYGGAPRPPLPVPDGDAVEEIKEVLATTGLL